MDEVKIDLGNTNNPDLSFPENQKLRFVNTGDQEITLTTPKGIKERGNRDKVRKTELRADGKPSRQFKITAFPGRTLEYSWNESNPTAQNGRNGRINVS